MRQKTLFGICIALLSVLSISGCGQEQILPIQQVQETELSSCDAFPDKLVACEPFSCEFEHPLIGGIMEKKIVGLVNGKCQYTEEMPNNGRMDCEYPEDLRKEAAQYYKDVAAAESEEVSVKADVKTGEVETKYFLNGKEIENPLQEALDTGVCIISGY